MSDLASSCEYHTIEKTCLAVSESPKAQANRQLRCLNDEKQSCCYICDSRQECAISCKFLGATHTTTQAPIEPPKPVPDTIPFKPTPTEAQEVKGIPTTYCTSCNIEMTPKKAKLRLDESDGAPSKQFGDYNPQAEETLAVIIYLCPLCGKIEFKANRGS
ncbi:MAG TPA: hypothetical protein VLH35_03830 [Candidatus Acidoferrales bacterium]|nr:hypothetical protein [Candidatus Acidoferrales bacterium]